MRNTLKTLSLAGAAMALAMSPGIVAAQDQTAPGSDSEMNPPSMPGDDTTTTPPSPTDVPSDTTMPADTTTDTTMPANPDASEGLPQQTVPGTDMDTDDTPADGTTLPDTTMPDTTVPGTTTPGNAPPPPLAAADTAQTAPAGPTISPAEQEAMMANWPAETQAYYQSLDQERQQMFWALTDTDKVRLSQLPEDQREAAWGQIKAQFEAMQA